MLHVSYSIIGIYQFSYPNILFSFLKNIINNAAVNITVYGYTIIYMEVLLKQIFPEMKLLNHNICTSSKVLDSR